MTRSARRGTDACGSVDRARWLPLLLSGALLTPAASAATLTEHMDIACVQSAPLALDCAYRLLAAGELHSVVAEWHGEVVEGKTLARYPAAGETTALLILVDTSDPARQVVIDKVKVQLAQLLDALPAHYRPALARFDTELTLLAPIGASVDEVRAAIATLTADGKTTELYRNVREAVRLIADANTSRKALLILSDGLAEDYAYHHDDVVTLAREHAVVIDSVGYPRSVAQSVALQTLRRLSDETGGLYVQASHLDYSIPGDSFARMLGALDSGGRLSFDLTTLAAAGAAGAIDLSLAFVTSEQSLLVLAPAVLPAAEPGAQPSTTIAAPAAAVTAQPPAVANVPIRPPPVQREWSWFGVLIGLLLLILAAVVLVLFRLRRAVAGDANPIARKPLAYLLMQDHRKTRHVIDKTPWRIGRGRTNDLTLTDHSVSRLHAEIRSNDEGLLTLNDLESLNGVFVNDNRIESIQLREGDAVDIGDVRMHFTLHDETYATQEPTVLVRTHTPV